MCTSDTQASYKTWHRLVSGDSWRASLRKKNVLDDFLFYYFEIGNSFHVTLPKNFQHPTSSVSFPNVPNTKSRWFIWTMIRDHRWHRCPLQQPDSCHRDHRREPTAHGKESPAAPLRVVPPGFEYGPLDATSKSPVYHPTDRTTNTEWPWNLVYLQLVPDVASSLATAQWKAHASHLRLFVPVQNGRRKWRHSSSWVGLAFAHAQVLLGCVHLLLKYIEISEVLFGLPWWQGVQYQMSSLCGNLWHSKQPNIPLPKANLDPTKYSDSNHLLLILQRIFRSNGFWSPESHSPLKKQPCDNLIKFDPKHPNLHPIIPTFIQILPNNLHPSTPT